LFLNDSALEDEEQAYAVVRDGRHIHTLGVSWMSRGEASGDINWLVQGGGGDYRVVEVQTEPFEDHACPLCQ
jgi:hypothetical protein